MKNIILPAIFAVILFNGVARSASQTELHLGVSPFLNAAQRQALAQQLPELLLNPARFPGGSRLVVWDAWRLVVVSDLTIPNLKFDSREARTPYLVKPMVAIGQWLRAAPPADAAIPHEFPAIKTPEWLELVSRSSPTGLRSVLLLGSPIYLNLTEPTFSMTEARYPADGHLRVTMQESVFGLAEKTNRLVNASIHWCYFSEQIWQTELHRTAVTRFWGLFMQGQGGGLATFGADLPAALANVSQTGLPPCGRFAVDPDADKLEMRTAVPRAIPLWLQPIASPQKSQPPAPTTPGIKVSRLELPSLGDGIQRSTPPAQTPAPAPTTIPEQESNKPPVISAPASSPLAPIPTPPNPEATVNPLPIDPTSGKLGIGILWDVEGVDLDLYIRPTPNSPELSYRNTRTEDGIYFHDYRNKNSHLDYEFVELDPSVDIKTVSAWVNFYKGNAKEVTGKVCIFHGGKPFVAQFSLRADRGNRGADSSHRATSPYWAKLSIHELLDNPKVH